MWDDVAQFLFIGAAVVAVFAFLSVASWAGIRAGERKALERYALLRKLAELPTESARLILEDLRNDEERKRQARAAKQAESWVERLQGGFVVGAVGIGLMVMLQSLEPGQGLWSVGLIPTLVGLVMIVFALFTRRTPPGAA
jgi:hypothetical protein